MVDVHIISYHASGSSPRKFKSTGGEGNRIAVVKNLWVENAGCHIRLQALKKFLSLSRNRDRWCKCYADYERGGVGFEVLETYKLDTKDVSITE